VTGPAQPPTCAATRRELKIWSANGQAVGTAQPERYRIRLRVRSEIRPGIMLRDAPLRGARFFVVRNVYGDKAELVETCSHSFIVKIWLEETAEEAGHAVWRGTIAHVRNGRQQPLRRLGDIRFFIVPYLEAMGVKPSVSCRLRRWLRRRTRGPRT
jgi:hypothetical protein